MRHHHTYVAVLALLGAAGALGAQERPRDASPERERDAERRARRVYSMVLGGDEDRARLGISLGASGRRDTLGVLVADVTSDGPAAKAGLDEGDRIAAINGVNLRLSPADVDEQDMEGIGARRLSRELGKVTAGDEVELLVWRDGRTRTVKVKTAAARDLFPARGSLRAMRAEREERATLGIGLGTSGSRRDTLGIFVSSVVDDGPAAKAGMEEGDRIAAINGVDLRVPGEDAGDWAASASRIRRLNREMEKVKAGDEVELRLYRAGQGRTVRVKTVAMKELADRRGMSFFFGGGEPGWGEGFEMLGPAVAPVPQVPPTPPAPPRAPRVPAPLPPRVYYFDGGDLGEVRVRMGDLGELGEFGAEAGERAREAVRRALEVQSRLRPRLRMELNDATPRLRMPMVRAERVI